MTRTYRDLTPLPVAEALRALQAQQPAVIVTMSEGQWDGLLSAAYAQGCILLELDDDEHPVRAFQRRPDHAADGQAI